MCSKLSEATAGCADTPPIVLSVSRERQKRETKDSMYSEIVHLCLIVSFIGIKETRRILQVGLVTRTVSNSNFIQVLKKKTRKEPFVISRVGGEVQLVTVF